MSKVNFASMRHGDRIAGAHQTPPILSGKTADGALCELVATIVIDAVGHISLGFEVGTDDDYSAFFAAHSSPQDLFQEAQAVFFDMIEDEANSAEQAA